MTYKELEESTADIVIELEQFCAKNKLSTKKFLSLRRMIRASAERGAITQGAKPNEALFAPKFGSPIDVPTNFGNAILADDIEEKTQ